MFDGGGLAWERSDKWVWLRDPSGAYSVRFAYSWIHNSDYSASKNFHKKLWSCGAPLKVKGFVWKLAQDRIPTVQNLARREGAGSKWDVSRMQV